MHNGRVAYFEDNESLARSIIMSIDLFSDGRHKVVAHAADLGGALSVLDQVASGKIDVDIILSDGNLSPGSGGHDVRTIMERVTELGLDVKTVLMSSQSAKEIGVTVDAALDKGNITPFIIVDTFDSL